MARTRQRMKGRRTGGRFVALPHNMLQSSEYAALSARAVKLIVDLMAQFNGQNNGDLSPAPSLMRKHGWRSNSMLNAAVEELVAAGFIVQTRIGWRNHAALYAVSWLRIDHCGAKLDITPPSGGPLNLWKQANRHLIDDHRLALGVRPGENKNASPPAGIYKPADGHI
jgi:hypothetical protein